jgi:hypothetical protein
MASQTKEYFPLPNAQPTPKIILVRIIQELPDNLLQTTNAFTL